MRPDATLDALAGRVVDQLEAQRVEVLAALSACGPNATGTLNPAETGRHELPAALTKSLSEGMLRGDLGEFEQRVNSLRCDPEKRTAFVAVCSYFLKYRYLELTDLRSAAIKDRGRYWEKVPVFELPRGWEELLGPVDVAGKCSVAREMATRLTSAPWLGALRKDAVADACVWFIQLGFLEIALDADLASSLPSPDHAEVEGLPVLRVVPAFPHVRATGIRVQLEGVLADRCGAEAARRGLVVDKGTAVKAIGALASYQLWLRAGPNDMVKLATYHLRTVIGEKELATWLSDNPTLTVKILCLGPTSTEALTEGADPVSLAVSLSEGIVRFTQDLPRDLRKRVQVRIYGDKEGDALFRGSILADGSGNPVRVVAVTWPFRECRASYGEILEMDGASNTARLINDYYDRSWEQSVPVPSMDFLQTAGWVFAAFKDQWSVLLTAALAFGVIVAARVTELNTDAPLVLISCIPVLLSALFAVGLRLWRANAVWARVTRARQALSTSTL